MFPSFPRLLGEALRAVPHLHCSYSAVLQPSKLFHYTSLLNCKRPCQILLVRVVACFGPSSVRRFAVDAPGETSKRKAIRNSRLQNPQNTVFVQRHQMKVSMAKET